MVLWHLDGTKSATDNRTESAIQTSAAEIQAQTSRRKGPFVRTLLRLLHALQEARQREAEREIAHYQELTRDMRDRTTRSFRR
jgi:hypothetical protein